MADPTGDTLRLDFDRRLILQFHGSVITSDGWGRWSVNMRARSTNSPAIGIMVFFNDRMPCPDPAERDVKMAMAMREAAGKLIATWHRHGSELSFGAGVARGYATLGQIGFSDRSGYTAIGTVSTSPPGFVLRPRMGGSWSSAASLKRSKRSHGSKAKLLRRVASISTDGDLSRKTAPDSSEGLDHPLAEFADMGTEANRSNPSTKFDYHRVRRQIGDHGRKYRGRTIHLPATAQPKIRDVIDAIHLQVVLILGRFTKERRVVLDALPDELRTRNYLPILFDFEMSASQTQMRQ